jgi:hypothetical protein
VSVPATVSRMPPIAGPTKMPTLSMVVSTRFAAVSSSGRRTSDGSNADCVGRNVDCSRPMTLASA